jgi:hypothetical protein
MAILRKTISLGLIPLLVLTSLVLINDVPEVTASISGEFPPDPEIYKTLAPGDYTIGGDLWIPVGKTLNVSAGVNFLFPDALYNFTVYGTLDVRGTSAPGGQVNFRSDAVVKGPGKYGSVVVDGGIGTFNYTNIEHATEGLMVINAAPILNYVNIRNCTYGILGEQAAHPSAYNLTIENCVTRDIKLDNSRLDIQKGLFDQSTTKSTASVEMTANSFLRIVNGTFEDKYSQLFRMDGGSEAFMINNLINFTGEKLAMEDEDSYIYLQNFLDIFVGYRDDIIINPLPGTTVKVKDDFNYTSDLTDINGEINRLVTTYITANKEYLSTNKIKINQTQIEIDYGNIFVYTRQNIDMSTSHTEFFINEAPKFNLSSKYTLKEDSKNEKFLDLWEVTEDDFDTYENLDFFLLDNYQIPEVNGTPVAEVTISKDSSLQESRYLNVNLTKYPAGINWTGEFYIEIEAHDPLGNSTDISNITDPIKIVVEQVNDAPVWIDMFDIWMDEDTLLLDAINLVDFVDDSDTPLANISFELVGYDKTNFSLVIDNDHNLDIRLLNEHFNGYTDVTFSAYDEDLYGNHTVQIHVRPTQDKPVINRSLVNFTMDEDTEEIYTFSLYQAFTDHDGDNLTFGYDGNEYINVTIDQVSGMVTFEPIEDWYGEETINFYANDSFEHSADSMTITVNNINDPPGIPEIIFPDPDSDKVFREGEPILFVVVTYDADIHNPDLDSGLIDDLLKYSWTSNTTQMIRITDNFTYSELPEGKHRITVTVTDLSGESTSTFVDVTIFGSFSAPTVKHLSPLPASWTNVPNMKLEWSVDSDPATLPFVRFDILMDENINPTTVVAEKISVTSYIVTDLRKATYYWTIIPYVIDTQGTDLDGVWYFDYDLEAELFFDLELKVEPGGLELFPGDSGTVDISVTNIGSMGEGDKVWGMMSEETETFQVFFTVPENFDVFDTFEIVIEVQSIHRDEMRPGNISLKINQKEDKGNITSPKDRDLTLLIMVIVLIIVIIAAIGIIMFALQHKHKKEEEEGEGEEEEAHDELESQIPIAAGGAPTPAQTPATAPEVVEASTAAEPAPVEDFGTVTCGPCGASIPLTSKDKPLDVTCQECGNSFTVKS